LSTWRNLSDSFQRINGEDDCSDNGSDSKKRKEKKKEIEDGRF